MEWIGGVAAIIALILILMEKGGNNNSSPYSIEPTADSTIYKVVDQDGNIKTYGSYQDCEEWIRSH